MGSSAITPPRLPSARPGLKGASVEPPLNATTSAPAPVPWTDASSCPPVNDTTLEPLGLVSPSIARASQMRFSFLSSQPEPSSGHVTASESSRPPRKLRRAERHPRLSLHRECLDFASSHDHASSNGVCDRYQSSRRDSELLPRPDALPIRSRSIHEHGPQNSAPVSHETRIGTQSRTVAQSQARPEQSRSLRCMSIMPADYRSIAAASRESHKSDKPFVAPRALCGEWQDLPSVRPSQTGSSSDKHSHTPKQQSRAHNPSSASRLFSHKFRSAGLAAFEPETLSQSRTGKQPIYLAGSEFPLPIEDSRCDVEDDPPLLEALSNPLAADSDDESDGGADELDLTSLQLPISFRTAKTFSPALEARFGDSGLFAIPPASMPPTIEGHRHAEGSDRVFSAQPSSPASTTIIAPQHDMSAECQAMNAQEEKLATRRQVHRVYKRVRLRVRYMCERCQSTFAGREVCDECGHRRCHECVRLPSKRARSRSRSCDNGAIEVGVARRGFEESLDAPDPSPDPSSASASAPTSYRSRARFRPLSRHRHPSRSALMSAAAVDSNGVT